MQVFVSYTWTKNPESSRAVNDFTKRFEEKLKGAEVFQNAKVFQDIRGLDQTNLNQTALIKAELEKALNDSDVLLVLVSSDWLNSTWCRWEFDTFKGARQNTSLPIVPVLWRDNDTTLEASSDNPIACELAELYRAISADSRSDEPASIRKIAELANKVVKSISPKKREKAEGPDTRASPDTQINAVGPNTAKTPPRKSPPA